MKKRKIGFVVQRYGPEVNGGSEMLCRMLAERLSKYYDIEVITTCAINHSTWADEYPPGLQQVNNVPVRRFPVSYTRNPRAFDEFCHDLFAIKKEDIRREEELEWMRQQGPYSQALLQHLEQNKDAYDLFVFFTYLYCTTYFGLPLVKEKALLLPTAHDEEYIYLSIFDELFRIPMGFIFLAPEEKRLVHKLFKNEGLPHAVTGIGIDPPLQNPRIEDFKRKFNLSKPYILYLGRIEPGKGSGGLFASFLHYKQSNQRDIQLVLVGKNLIDIPSHPDIRHLGFVSEEDKYNAIAGAELLVNSSLFESLSIVIMEAWSLGIPVLVNGRSDVMVGQCTRSNGGLWYENTDDFCKCLNWFLDHKDLASELGRNGREYVTKHYSWPAVEQRYMSILGKYIPAQ